MALSSGWVKTEELRGLAVQRWAQCAKGGGLVVYPVRVSSHRIFAFFQKHILVNLCSCELLDAFIAYSSNHVIWDSKRVSMNFDDFQAMIRMHPDMYPYRFATDLSSRPSPPVHSLSSIPSPPIFPDLFHSLPHSTIPSWVSASKATGKHLPFQTT